MNRYHGSNVRNPTEEARLPSFINISIPDPRQRPPSSPRGTNTTTSSSFSKKARSPGSPQAIASSGNTSSSTITSWQERKSAKPSAARRTVTRESYLVTLSRQQKWKEVLERVEQHPEEAVPKELILQEYTGDAVFGHSYHTSGLYIPGESSLSLTSTDIQPIIIYQETPLYLACLHGDFSQHNHERMLRVLKALFVANENQATISHIDHGHTALRALLKNPTCTTDALHCLLSVMKKKVLQDQTDTVLQKICYQQDRDGLNPLQHILQRIHHPSPPRPSTHTMRLLQVFLENVGIDTSQQEETTPSSSPLVYLLSLGNARITHAQTTPRKALFLRGNDHDHDNICSHTQSTSNSNNVLLREAIQYLLQSYPELLNTRAQMTQCTPLHIALCNYGDDIPLMKCFLLGPDYTSTTDTSSTSINPQILPCLQQSNQFGDLPLHVACSVGVPVSVLRWVLEGTVQAQLQNADSPLCWSVNRAGYTPLDLEWIRHMEDGKGLFMPRAFYSLEVNGIRKTWWKQDEFYRELLQKAVEQAIIVAVKKKPVTATRRRICLHPAEKEPTWQVLLDRMFLIMQTAATGRVPDTKTELVECILHAACKLVNPEPPSLPKPLLKLLLSMYPDQLNQPDQHGNLPLHYALQPYSCLEVEKNKLNSTTMDSIGEEISLPVVMESTYEPCCEDWKRWTMDLLRKSPEACTRTNCQGRLPLHMALDFADRRTKKSACNFVEHAQEARFEVIRHLVEAYPDSVTIPEGSSGLLSCQMAALCIHVKLDAVFYLLYRSPVARNLAVGETGKRHKSMPLKEHNQQMYEKLS